jgi:hypothetical protein
MEKLKKWCRDIGGIILIIVVVIAVSFIILKSTHYLVIVYFQPPTTGGSAPTNIDIIDTICKLFELHLLSLTLILSVVTFVFVGFQIYFQYTDKKQKDIEMRQKEAERKQQESMSKHIDTFMKRSNDLIEATVKVMNISGLAQSEVSKFKEQNDQRESQNREEIRRLETHTNRFLTTHGRFIYSNTECQTIRNMINQTERSVGTPNLPTSAFLIRGYYASLEESNSLWGIQEFTRVIDRTDDLLIPRALLNRGINRANLGQYNLATEDIQRALNERQGNLLYKFYLVDTQLLEARHNVTITGNPISPNLINSLRTDLFFLFNNCLGATAVEPGEEMRLSLLQIRIVSDLLSFLIWNVDDSGVEVRQILDNLPVNVCEHIFILFFKFTNQRRLNVLQHNDVDLENWVGKVRGEYQISVELNRKILRGMFLLHGYCWQNNVNLLNEFKLTLSHDVNIFGQRFGQGVTIFSPISQQNRFIPEILNEIANFCLPQMAE